MKREKESNKASENLGLNPSHKGEDDPEKSQEQSPAYLSNILEQDFYDSGDTKGKNIKGMTIGLAMNSVYYQKRKMERLIAKNLMIRKLKNKVNKNGFRNLNKIKSQ